MQRRWKSIVLIVTTLAMVLALGVVMTLHGGSVPVVAQEETETPTPTATTEADEEEEDEEGTADAQEIPADLERTISVSGSGTVGAEPDQIVLRLGVETMAETASDALSENSEQMQEVIEALEDADVPPENIQTQIVQLRPQYETPPQEPGQEGERELIGYVASNVVEARSEDLEAVGELLDAAVEAGANRIDQLRFVVTDQADLLSDAREAAWEDAEEKAQQLAELAGAELGAVVSITESTNVPRPVGFGDAAMEQAAAVPVRPGSEEITVDLQVTWLLQ